MRRWWTISQLTCGGKSSGSAAAAGSGGILIQAKSKAAKSSKAAAGQSPAKKRSHRRTKKAGARLGGVLEGGGALSSLGAMFTAPKKPEPGPGPELVKKQPDDFSGKTLQGPSSGSLGDGLSEEAERLLAGIPAVIGDGSAALLPDAVEPGAAGSDADGDGALLAAMVGSEICDAEDVAQVVTMVGGWLAGWRKREVYRVDKASAGLMARPWAAVVNHLWMKHAPSLLTSACDSVPGLAKALLMTGVVFVPAVLSDVQQTRAERAARPMIQPRTAQNVPEPVAVAVAEPEPTYGRVYTAGSVTGV